MKQIRSRTVVLPTKDIDTDQIIPARFLTTTTCEGLGANLFNDLRFNNDGSKKADFVLDRTESAGCEILVAGNNFGCGSSREHAPWALLDYGIRAVISSKIADIFRNNSYKNSLVAIEVDDDTHDWLIDNPGAELCIDVEKLSLIMPDGTVVSFPMDAFARYCLIEGIDELGYLQQHSDAIQNFEETRDWTP